MTLQITGASFVCNMMMWEALIDTGETPNWFVELQFPFAAPGVYDLADVGGYETINSVEVEGGGGIGDGPLESGIVEITYVGDDSVVGTLSGLVVHQLNGVDYDLNGTFEATRCTAEDWLDAHPEEPHDPPLPEGCLHP